jgi:hypothetical protein
MPLAWEQRHGENDLCWPVRFDGIPPDALEGCCILRLDDPGDGSSVVLRLDDPGDGSSCVEPLSCQEE